MSSEPGSPSASFLSGPLTLDDLVRDVDRGCTLSLDETRRVVAELRRLRDDAVINDGIRAALSMLTSERDAVVQENTRLREVEAAAREFLFLVEDAARGESHAEREWNAREDALRQALAKGGG